jgi:hypothetical protein
MGQPTSGTHLTGRRCGFRFIDPPSGLLKAAKRIFYLQHKSPFPDPGTADLTKTAISATTTRAGANLIFHDVIPPFIGHAVCDDAGGSSTEWINGLSGPTSVDQREAWY